MAVLNPFPIGEICGICGLMFLEDDEGDGSMERNNTSMSKQAVHEKVRRGYADIAGGGGSCCGPSNGCCGGGASAGVAKAVGYSDAELATLPDGANMGLSCGNPVAIAALKPG